MYLDSAYVAKFYLNEPDSSAVREAMRRADSLITSAWSVAEVTCAFHRHFREGTLNVAQFQRVAQAFREHVEIGFWALIPVTQVVLARMTARVAALPASIFLRAGDAVQLASAVESGEHEIWGSDRRMLAAAPHFGLTGRSV
ncbi:MAG TPA: type II toxin-antitoxin system VapC family toxin [Candidatus Acidoferrales bacterium]|jgi:predicted nucleic acid-binding protein|nr:type II toxin-antitoxin system VapC family toxin [Candidatus Acidoferrales bacterium]